MILAVGLLPLAAMFATGVKQMAASTPMRLAREKAREAIESVHAARDTGRGLMGHDSNVADGGIFLYGTAETIRDRRAPDGLVNTDDDAAADLFSAAQYTCGRSTSVPSISMARRTIESEFARDQGTCVRYRVNQAAGARTR